MRPTLQRILIVFSVILIVVACSDSNERRARLTPEERTQQLTDDLGLNKEQAEKIRTILTVQQEKFSQLRNEFSGDRSEMMSAMREMREEIDEQIKEVLDAEQTQKYEQLQEERRSQFRRRREQRE